MPHYSSPLAPGGLWWANPPQIKLQAPQIEIWNAINQWMFVNVYNVKPLAQTQRPPIENFLATVLHYRSIKTALSEPFGMQSLLRHHPNLESTHMKLRLTTWLMMICHMRPVEGFDQLQFAETPFSAGNSIGEVQHNPKCNKYVRMNFIKTCLENRA